MGKNKTIMKRMIALFLVFVLALSGTITNPAGYVQAAGKKKVSSVRFKKDTLVLKKGKKAKLKTVVKPKNAANKKVSYKSSRKAVAQVDSKGKITAKKAGKTIITATAKDGSRKKAKCTVYVYTKRIKKATVTPAAKELQIGETVKLKTKVVSPKKGTANVFTWKSSDKKVAVVDKKGKVTAKGAGTAVIKATAMDGSKKSAVCVVTVKKAETPSKAWEEENIASPGNKVQASFKLDKNGALTYQLNHGSEVVVEPSPTGLVTSLGDFTKGLKYKSTESRENVKDEYTLIGAKKKNVSATYNEKTFWFEKEGVSYGIAVRAYDDGVAFRYLVRKDKGGELKISAENTGIGIPKDSSVTVYPYDYSNEGWPQTVAISELESLSDDWGEPTTNFALQMTYQLKDKETYVLASEADLQDTYCGAKLVGHTSGMMDLRFCDEQKGDVVTTAPFQSPWRYFVIGDLSDIALNTMAENLNPPCEIDTSWIKPGAMAWTWVNGDPCDDFETYKKYVDLASEMGWQYLLLDEGWYKQDNNRVFLEYYDWTDDLIAYANEKNIGLVVWAHVKNLQTEEQQKKIKEWADMGFKGFKPDFFESASQDTVKLLNDLIKLAADNHMLMDPHGIYKPTGVRRTYPHVLTQEGVSASEGRSSDSFYNCTMPFTRLAIGPADYAPLASFSNAEVDWIPGGVPDMYLNTTYAAMAAEAVLFESGLQCLADKPENYEKSVAKDFYKNMPAEWDESVLVGENKMGGYVNIARRSGKNWYMGIMCNDEYEHGTENYTQKRDKAFTLDFLEEGKTYRASIYEDGATKREMTARTQDVKKGDTITVSCLPYGGAALKLVEMPNHDGAPGTEAEKAVLDTLYDTRNIVQFQAAGSGNMVIELNDGTGYYDIWWNWIDSSGGLQTAFRLRPVSDGSTEFRIQTGRRARDKRGAEDKRVMIPAEDGANLALTDVDEKDESQIWYLRKLENGNYIIVNKASSKVIALKSDSHESGTEVCLKDYDAADTYMQWEVLTREEEVPEVDPTVLLDKTMFAAGETAKIEIGEVEPDEVTATYTSSDSAVATVSSDGTVTAVKGGSATITTSVVFEGKTYTFTNQIVVAGAEQSDSVWQVTSPDGNIKGMFVMDKKQGTLCYAAYHGEDLVIEPSPLGLVTNQGDFRSGLTFKSVSKVETIKDSYELLGAKVKNVTAEAKQITIMFEKDGVSYGVAARAYNDGIAFRYKIEGTGELTISEENTGVKIPLGSEVTVAEYDEANERIPAGTPLEYLIGNYSLMMTYQLQGKDVYALVSEADLQGSYCVSMLQGHPSGMMDIRFCPKQQEVGDVVTTAPFESPWRYAVIGNLNNIAVNTMAENLNPPCTMDTSWIKPGAMAWTWVNGDRCDDLDTYKKYVDLASEMGWQYLLLDEGWYVQENRVFVKYYDWTQELIDYADEKNVGLIVWAHKKNLETEEGQKKIKEWADMGFKGFKPDFFDSGSQETVKLVKKLEELAAENHMLMDPHGVYKPTGVRRTYPHVLTQEGISASEGRMAYSSYNTTLPFTRFAIGPGDYAPLASFANAELYNVDDRYLEASFAGLAAEAVLFESGLQCLADKPANYDKSVAKEFYRNMPAGWDESLLVDGKIGQYVNMARRSGSSWYVGIMCNDPFEYGTENYTQKRDKTFTLDFLEEGKTYTANIYSDGATKTEVAATTQEVKKGDKITVSCLPYGGAAIKLTPKQ